MAVSPREDGPCLPPSLPQAHAPLSSEDDASPGCVTSSQVPFKAFLSSPELRIPRGSDRKLSPLLSPLQDPLVEKTLLETRDVGRPKKVCFSESSLPSGDRTRRSYYLNGEEGEDQAGVGGWLLGRVVRAQLLHPASSRRRRVCPCSWGLGHPRASSAKTRGFHTQLDEGPETP